MIIRDTFDPDVDPPPIDWTMLPIELLAAEAADPDGDPAALAELARRTAGRRR